jgi:hypothetical protein
MFSLSLLKQKSQSLFPTYFHCDQKGVGEEAKKKFTFKPVIIYIEDTDVFSPTNDNKLERLERLRRIQKSVEYSGFKAFFSLLENVSYLGAQNLGTK